MWLWPAVFAIAITAFLVLSIVCTIIVEAKIVGLELPHSLPLPAAVLGGWRIRQHRRAAPLMSESLSVSLSLSLSPNHCTVLVRCHRPPCCGPDDADNDPPVRRWKTRMKTHRCRLNNASPFPSLSHEARGAPSSSPPLFAPPPHSSSDVSSAALDPSSSSSSSHVTSTATASWQPTFCQIPNFHGLVQYPPRLAL